MFRKSPNSAPCLGVYGVSAWIIVLLTAPKVLTATLSPPAASQKADSLVCLHRKPFLVLGEAHQHIWALASSGSSAKGFQVKRKGAKDTGQRDLGRHGRDRGLRPQDPAAVLAYPL